MPISSATDRLRVAPTPGGNADKGGASDRRSPAAFDQDARHSDAATALTVRGLRKTYHGPDGAHEVLRGIDFSVQRGQSVAIVGANGSGKSTALRCSMRLIEPSAGDIRIDNTAITGLSGKALRQARAKVGFVFQRHNLCARLRVLSNVMHGALARGAGPRAWSHSFASKLERDRALECLQQVGLADLAGRRADKLSGGQSQRVAIARALMQEPTMLLADEPVASLDPKAGRDVMTLFARLQQQAGITLVFVSHDLEHALDYSDRVIGLKSGRLVLDRSSSGLCPDDLAWLYETEAAE